LGDEPNSPFFSGFHTSLLACMHCCPFFSKVFFRYDDQRIEGEVSGQWRRISLYIKKTKEFEMR